MFGFCVKSEFITASFCKRTSSAVQSGLRYIHKLFAVAILLSLCSEVSASPLAAFDKPSERSCSGSDVCNLTVFSRQTVGGYTGIMVTRSGAGKGRIAVTPGRASSVVQIESQGEGIVSATLSWDGDPNARVLSGAGLGCFNFKASHGVAIIIKDFVAKLECRDESGAVALCADIVVESKLYAASDPTGQVFSASRIRWKVTDDTARDLVIPFSNFVRSSPSGTAQFDCAGALTITFKSSGARTFKIGMRSVLIDDEYGAAPRPSPVVNRSFSSSTPSPSLAPTQTYTPLAPLQKGDSGELLAATPASAPTVTPAVTPTVAPTVASPSAVVESPETPVVPQGEGEPESVTTYGSVIAG